MGVGRATELLNRLEFHPVFTAHPTEARRKAVEGKIRRIALLLAERPYMGGSDLAENQRHLLQEIDALVRTSPISVNKGTPVEGSGHHYRRVRQHATSPPFLRFTVDLDHWVLGQKGRSR